MNEQANASISLLSMGSPPRTAVPHSDFQRLHPSIRGRLHTSQQVGLTPFLDVDAVEDESHSSDIDNPDEQHFDRPRKKVKRGGRARRIARPKDSMPGFRRRRYGNSRRSRFSKSQFPLRGGAAVGGSRHLDRGMTSAAYYGRLDDGADFEGQLDQTTIKKLGELEAELNGVLGSEIPVCLVHGDPCVTFVCKKPGKNKGREFFKCGRRQRYEQCDFFRWVDEPPKLFSDAEDTDDGAEEDSVDVPAVFDIDGDNYRSLNKILRVFGHSKFRPGQAEALRLLLAGTSTLALLPTGGGKSLIYQMFAGVRSGVVVVVTPLVSLMLDQLACLPEELPGACLRSGQTLEVLNATEQKLREGKIKVLFISPERLFSTRFRRLMRSRGAPKVSLVVLDEAHCISQWSHNFRTAYLRIPRTLFETSSSMSSPLFKEEPLILALTATATAATVRGICNSLKIDYDGAVVRCSVNRDNLKLALSRADASVDAKASELVDVLKQEPFAGIMGIGKDESNTGLHNNDICNETSVQQSKSTKKRRRTSGFKNDEDDEMIGWGSNLQATKRVQALRKRGKRKGSLIVYVTKQKDCASVTNYLKSAVLNIDGNICMYHAGLSQNERTKVQRQFERGSIPILVATVAFGMGLNYSNVRGVIHFDMPCSLEGYWQEIGRAGRDGRNAFCHILFNEYDGRRLLSRSHSDGVDKSTVRQIIRCLLNSAFKTAKRGRQTQQGGEIAQTRGKAGHGDISVVEKDDIPQSEQESDSELEASESVMLVLTIDEQHLRKSFDIKNETAETICAILESELPGFSMRKWSNTKFRLKFFSKSPEELLKSTSKAVTTQDRRMLSIVQQRAKQNSGHYDLDLGEALMVEDQVIGAFNRLQAGRHISFEPLKQGLQVQCDPRAHRILKKDADALAEIVHRRLDEIQIIRTKQAQTVVNAFSKADEMLSDIEQSSFLHETIQQYFKSDWNLDDIEEWRQVRMGTSQNNAMDEVKTNNLRTAASELFVETRYGSTAPQSARQIARIMHGIDSAGFRAKDWCRNRYWGRFVQQDFELTKRIAATVLREQHMSQKQKPKVG